MQPLTHLWRRRVGKEHVAARHRRLALARVVLVPPAGRAEDRRRGHILPESRATYRLCSGDQRVPAAQSFVAVIFETGSLTWPTPLTSRCRSEGATVRLVAKEPGTVTCARSLVTSSIGFDMDGIIE